MNNKHTPGPWYWSRDTMEDRCDITLHSKATGYSILYCCAKPREPNARLMAAAPDLLDALQEIADSDRYEITCLKDDKPKYAYGKFAEIALHAIAKATGG